MTAVRRTRIGLSARSGLVLFAVLVIVGSAVLVATTVVFLVGGEVAGGANERELLRVRAAGLSAVHVVAARLGAQRQLMLEGGTPLLDGELTLWETTGEVATARLLPVDVANATLIAENGRVPFADATVESLVATGAIDESLAGRILALRDGGPRLGSIDALLQPRGGADGLTPVELYGPLDWQAAALSEDPRERRDRSHEASVGSRDGIVPARDLLTVHSHEPPVRSDGSPRLRLDVEWTDDHRGGVDAALGSGSAVVLEAAMKGAEPTIRSLFALWRVKHVDPREWHAFLDSVTLGEGTIERRIDIMHAATEVLRTLPGVSKDIAERIVREREGLPAESRRSIAWLVERSVLDADACAALVERATTRSLLWRVRIVTTIVREKESMPRSGVVFEAVIDCSEQRPRIAALRDLTGIDTLVSMLLSEPPREGREQEDAPIDAEPQEEPATDASESAAWPAAPSTPPAVEPPARRGVGRWRPSQ